MRTCQHHAKCCEPDAPMSQCRGWVACMFGLFAVPLTYSRAQVEPTLSRNDLGNFDSSARGPPISALHRDPHQSKKSCSASWYGNRSAGRADASRSMWAATAGHGRRSITPAWPRPSAGYLPSWGLLML